MTNITLFFDLDGTIMVNPFLRVVFPRVTQFIGHATGLEPERILQEITQEHDQRMANDLDEHVRVMDWDDIIATVADRHGVVGVPSAETLVIQHAHPPHTALIDDSVNTLKHLKQGGRRKLVVASMGLARYQVPVLKGLDLYPLFDDFLMPDLSGYLKTERKFYKDYPAQEGLRIHIGDRYDHDCYFPSLWGAKTILRLPFPEFIDIPPMERPALLKPIRWRVGGMLPEMNILPSAVVIHLSELLEVVEILERQA